MSEPNYFMMLITAAMTNQHQTFENLLDEMNLIQTKQALVDTIGTFAGVIDGIGEDLEDADFAQRFWRSFCLKEMNNG